MLLLQAIKTCPDGWHQLPSLCFYVGKTKTNYNNALSICRSMGANVFLPLTEEETKTLKGFLTLHDRYWIGLTLEPNTNKFCTASGTPPTYTKWGGEEPNNIPWENCVQIKPSREGFWNNIRCSLAMYYICEIRC